MGTMQGPTEGGSGGKRGHSAMEHWADTDEIKTAARGARRRQDRQACDEQVDDALADPTIEPVQI